MKADGLLAHYARIADAPDAIAKLRRFVLDLAVRGKLVEQDAGDEPATKLLERISAEKTRLLKAGAIKKPKSVPEPAEAPFAIPTRWAWSQITEIGVLSPRNDAPDGTQASFVPMTLIAAEYGAANGHEVRTWREIKKGYTHFAEGDVGLAKITPCFENGKSTVFRNLAGEMGSGTTELHVVRPLMVNPDYVLIFLKSPHFIESGIPKMTGTAGQKRVPTEYFAYSPFPLPPLAEQHRIVAKVDELMALCDQLEAARAQRETTRDRLAAASLARLNTPDPDPDTFHADARFALDALPALTTRPDQIKQLRQTILSLAVRGKLVHQHAGDEPAAHALNRLLLARLTQTSKSRKSKTSPEPKHEDGAYELPNGWTWASTLEVCSHVDSGSTPPAAEMKEGDGDIPFIKVYNLTKTGKLDFSVKPTFVSEETHQKRLARSKIFPGDVLMNIVGPPLGKVSIVPPIFPEWNTNQAVVLFRPLPDLLPRYLAVCLMSTSVLSWIIDLAQQTVGQVNISVGKSRRLPIPLPPLAEQHRIVAKVDELMALCDQLEASLTAGETTRRRLLDALLHEALAPAAEASSEHPRAAVSEYTTAGDKDCFVG